MYNTKKQQLLEALKILELEIPVSYIEIKTQYKKLLKKWHPDKCKKNQDECKQKTIEIVAAAKLLFDYIENYKFSFDDKNDTHNHSIEDWWFNKFGNDSLWGQNK
ncbi:MAG TPA: J domain-containing protein [bacterium]|nr:J domain-containing protein [bacterium]